MAGPKERTPIDVGIKLWPRCRPELSVLRWTRRTTDGQRMSKFFPGDKSLSHSLLSAISSFALPSSARPCFPFSESDSPSPPSSLFARNLFGTYSPSVRTEGAKDGLGGEEEGEKWGKQKQPLRERANEATDIQHLFERDVQGQSRVWRSRPRSSSPQVAWKEQEDNRSQRPRGCPETTRSKRKRMSHLESRPSLTINDV